MPGTSPESQCRVCGWDEGDERWIGGQPLYVICSCCGTESGIEDHSDRSIAQARYQWQINGYPWFDQDLRPSGWTPPTN